MMRVVLDTNVLVRVVASPHGPAADLFECLGANDLLVTSAALLSELTEILAYDRIRKLHGLDDVDINRFVDRVAIGSLIAALEYPLMSVVLADPDDDAVVATAVAGRANVICTRNKHLRDPDVLAYCAAHSIRVADDLELLRELRARDAGGCRLDR
ncbi:MAG TPA: putative toxin-antitoxin system toxin component, PIN family [Pirellulales bacterium]|nr:putative toxin-antitoxin system toxin component, PIN family [Pirellulales bacterium]